MLKALRRAALALAAALLAPATALVGPAAAQGYIAQPGDVLRIEVVEDPSLNREVLITPDGSLSFPFAGSIGVSGRSVDQIRDQLVAGLRPQFTADPTVFVSVARLAPEPPFVASAPLGPIDTGPVEPFTFNVFITGEINSPGALAVEPGTTILQAIATAGGLTRFAADRRIELRRADASGRIVRYKYDIDGRTRSISGATPLAAGDVIVVPERRLFELD